MRQGRRLFRQSRDCSSLHAAASPCCLAIGLEWISKTISMRKAWASRWSGLILPANSQRLARGRRRLDCRHGISLRFNPGRETPPTTSLVCQPSQLMRCLRSCRAARPGQGIRQFEETAVDSAASTLKPTITLKSGVPRGLEPLFSA